MILDRLKNILEVNEAPVLKYLQKGVNAEYISSKASKAGLTFPENLMKLYTWQNGTNWEKVKLGLLWLFPGAMFFSLETALEIYSGRVNKDEFWKNEMFPVFGSGGGDFYLIDLNRSSPTFNQIFYYCLNDTDFDGIISFFDSLETGVQTIVKCYDEKAFFYYFDHENEKMLHFNSQAQRKIAKGLNPQSEYWPLYNFEE